MGKADLRLRRMERGLTLHDLASMTRLQQPCCCYVSHGSAATTDSTQPPHSLR